LEGDIFADFGGGHQVKDLNGKAERGGFWPLGVTDSDAPEDWPFLFAFLLSPQAKQAPHHSAERW
jgi:hypothetical protein